MRTLALPRLESNAFATYGHLIDEENRVLVVTLELPNRGNAKGISCIPAGAYLYRRRYSPEHKCQVFAAVNVPGRDDCEMHWGCLPRDSKGCTLVGTSFGFVDYADGKPDASGPGITGSKAAFDRFMADLDGVDEFMLVITDPPATLAAA